MFDGVKVRSVHTLMTHPKQRQRRGFAAGKSVRRKKAIVALAPGSREIDLFPGL
jgi:ribosomal protein L23